LKSELGDGVGTADNKESTNFVGFHVITNAIVVSSWWWA